MFYSTAVSQTFIKGDLYPYIYRGNAQPSAKCTFKKTFESSQDW